MIMIRGRNQTVFQQHKISLVIVLIAGVVDVKLLRHLASEIGNEWRHLSHSLGIRRVRLQAILRNHSGSNDTQQTVYDMLMSWMKRLPRSVNKVGLLFLKLVIRKACSTSSNY